LRVKKIFINGKFLSQRITGTQRYAREILDQFDLLLSSQETRDISIEVLVPRSAGSIPNYRNLRVRSVGRLNGVGWEQLELPHYCRGEILFTPSGGAPVLHARNVITIHDAAVSAMPAGYAPAYRIWYRNVCRMIAPKAEHIFTDSNFSKSEIVKWYGGNPKKISVVYLGSDHLRRVAAEKSIFQRLGIAGKYILAVSSHNPNKNFRRIVEAVELLGRTDMELLIAGGEDKRIYREGIRFPERTRALGYVTDAELKALYENATCFVFASLYEGFGLPALEAMASGCAVVLSRTACLPEIFDDVAHFCDPYSSQEIAAAIERTLQSPPATPVQLREFAARFTWERCARETLDVLRRV
jgi:glycosyltransferase involved in cell wall biosynthesis